jgi:hypothetical protein
MFYLGRLLFVIAVTLQQLLGPLFVRLLNRIKWLACLALIMICWMSALIGDMIALFLLFDVFMYG